MYEDMTYNIILQRMINRVHEWARQRGVVLDTREGSLIRTALSPAAVELALMYTALNEVLNESFADTQSWDFLVRRAAERGITPQSATYAIRRGVFNMDIPIGARFSLNRLNYKAIAKIETGVYQMQCETAGEIGNAESGALIPIDYLDGLTYAFLTDVLIPGEDEETLEHLRGRYFAGLNATAFGGNIQDYIEKTLSLDGVGGVKVYPVWNGGGTVKLVILDSQYKKPTSILVDSVQTAIDPTQNQGIGLGIAPIGHVVTVVGAEETRVDIAAHITFDAGWNWEALLPYAEEAIDQYFTALAQEWQGSSHLVVRISQIETRLLTLTGVLDVQDTLLNGAAANLELDPDNIPIRGGLTNG